MDFETSVVFVSATFKTKSVHDMPRLRPSRMNAMICGIFRVDESRRRNLVVEVNIRCFKHDYGVKERSKLTDLRVYAGGSMLVSFSWSESLMAAYSFGDT